MDKPTLDRAAALIAKARQQGTTLKCVPDEFLPTSTDEALTLFSAVNAQLRQDVAGYKVGATGPQVLTRENSLGPMLGTIPRHLLKASPAVFPRADFVCPVIEFEIAFEIANDLPPRASPYTKEEVLASTRSALVGIEVADPHIEEPFSQPIEALYADNGAAGGFVIGPDISGWRDRDLQCIEVSVQADDGTAVSDVSGDERPDAVWVLCWTANACARLGEGLKAGDYVTTGAIAPPVVLSAQTQWRADFVDIGEVCLSFAN